MVLWFYVQEHPKAHPAVVLILKCLRRRGDRLKSHPTDCEKPGIEPTTPGLQDKVYPLHHGGFFPYFQINMVNRCIFIAVETLLFCIKIIIMIDYLLFEKSYQDFNNKNSVSIGNP